MDYLVEWMNDRHITIRSDSVAASVIETAVANPNPTIVSTLPEEDGTIRKFRIVQGWIIAVAIVAIPVVLFMWLLL